MSDILTMAEAVAVTGIPADELTALLTGPSNRTLGPITLRQALGCLLTADLSLALNLQAAISVATTAANHAEPDSDRLLMVGWDGGGMRCAWRPPGRPFRPLVRHSFLGVPGDFALSDLAQRLADHRATSARPN